MMRRRMQEHHKLMRRRMQGHTTVDAAENARCTTTVDAAENARSTTTVDAAENARSTTTVDAARRKNHCEGAPQRLMRRRMQGAPTQQKTQRLMWRARQLFRTRSQMKSWQGRSAVIMKARRKRVGGIPFVRGGEKNEKKKSFTCSARVKRG